MDVYTDILDDAEAELCAILDQHVYIPVKEELSGCGRGYSLGMRKENFKGHIHRVINNALNRLTEKMSGDAKKQLSQE